MEYEIECRERLLTIQQSTDGKHGSTIWDSALILCKYFDLHAQKLLPESKPLSVLDVGSGTGIVGLYMAMLLDQIKINASVYLTDSEGS
jgi:methylase of polypeptide subunit release factors